MDTTGELDKSFAEGSPMANLSKSKKYTTADERRSSVESAYQACSINPPVTVQAMAEYIEVTNRCMRDRLNEMKDIFWVKGGIVGRVGENA